MKKDRIRQLVKIVALPLVFVMGFSGARAYGYWVDQIQGDWHILFSRPVTIHITGLTPPVKPLPEEVAGEPEPGAAVPGEREERSSEPAGQDGAVTGAPETEGETGTEGQPEAEGETGTEGQPETEEQPIAGAGSAEESGAGTVSDAGVGESAAAAGNADDQDE